MKMPVAVAGLKAAAAALMVCITIQSPLAQTATPAVTATSIPQRLTLSKAEDILVARNLPVLAARNGVDIARAQVLVAGTSPIPSVSYSQTVVNAFDTTEDSGGARFQAVPPLRSGAIGLSYVIERGNKLELRTRVAQSQVSVAEANVLDTIRTEIGQLHVSFVTALAARANLEVYTQNQATLDDTERLLRTQVRAGGIPEGDLIRFQANRVQYASDLYNALTTYEQAAHDVLASLGAKPSDVVRTGAPADIPRQLANAPVIIEGDLSAKPKAALDDASLRAGLEMRPDVIAARNALTGADNALELARAARYRDLTLGPSVARSTNATSVGVSISIPIFTAPLVEANIMVAAGQRSQAQTQADQALLRAQSEFDKAFQTVRLSQDLLQVYTSESLGRAEEAFTITRRAFERGGQTLLDLLDAQRTLNQTRVAANQARLGYLSALFQLEQAAGASGIVSLD